MKPKILVVDDSMTSRMLFKVHMPKEIECEIFEAADAASALKMADEKQPDLVVMDYNMPERNGAEIAREIMENGLRARYVLLTANTQKAVVELATTLGFATIVDKPINADKIRSMLDGLI
jgi:CheY-like chemotaxis protein